MKRLCLLLFSLLLVSCLDQKPDLSEPKSGTLGSLTFQYPKNWKITNRDQGSDFQSVILDTSSGGIFILKSYPVKESETIQNFAQSFSECASGEASFGKMETESLKGGETEGANRLTETFYMKLLGQKVEFKRFYEKKIMGDRCVFFILQETSDVIEDSEEGFSYCIQNMKE